jgi:hypothetical protein
MALLDEQPYIGYPQMGRRRAMPNRDVEMNQGLLRGASYYPYDLLGSPIDLINMGLKPLGMGSQKPVMGSDYLQSLAQQYGLSPQPTGSNAENVARLAMSAMNPATGARAVGRAIEPTMQALAPKAAQMTEDYLRSIGGIANIVPTDVARSIKMPTTLPTDDIFKKAVENTSGATITEDGLLMNVMRKQKPQQAETESVRGGVFYLPEGSTSMKHYGGTTGYGGTEKISGETLYKNPLVVKGATGGKAPETAYDELVGKGAYQEMRNDALRVRHPELISDKRYNLADAITPEQFLSKYAPDLEGYGDYIFSKSREGNQLAYALQEAAVAQKTRDAGYDAVIGYSKKRDGAPFLSEIFDVREAIYPSREGDYRLMDKFEGLLD